MSYIVRIKGYDDLPVTNEQAYALMEKLEKTKWGFQLNIWQESIWYFRAADVTVQKKKVVTDQFDWSHDSKRFQEIKVKRDKWTSDVIAGMSQEEKLTYTKMAYARFGKWKERVTGTNQQKGFDSYIKQYIKILIRWKKWYKDEYNTYMTPHFTMWNQELEKPELLK